MVVPRLEGGLMARTCDVCQAVNCEEYKILIEGRRQERRLRCRSCGHGKLLSSKVVGSDSTATVDSRDASTWGKSNPDDENPFTPMP
jgi:hypothetical protein